MQLLLIYSRVIRLLIIKLLRNMDNKMVALSNTYVTDFFVVNRWMLRVAGLWKPDTKNKYIQLCYRFYAVIVFLFVNLWFTFTEFVSVFYTYKNEQELIKNVNSFLTDLMGTVKVIFWYSYGHYLLKIMQALENPVLQYKSYKQFQPGEISRDYKKKGIKYSLLFLVLSHATLISCYIPPTITTAKFIIYGENRTSLPGVLPYYSWMPFSHDTGYKYLLAMAYQAGPMFFYVFSIVGMDTLFMNIMNCVSGNVTIIQGAFLTLRERCINRIDVIALPHNTLHEGEVLMTEMKIEMRKLTKHLQLIFKVCDKLERVCRYMTLCQVTATLFILCTSLYLVSMAPLFSNQFFAECLYMAAMFFQLFLYCWFGNEVTLKELPSYVWNSNWFATDTPFKKNMIFTMMRAKRPVYFTAGKFSPLTLPTFMSIIKTSYSIFALIKNISE